MTFKNNKNVTLTRMDISKDLFSLFMDIIERQNGRCVVTGFPLTFESNHYHTASMSRINRKFGFVDGNIEFMIKPLNTITKMTSNVLKEYIKENRITS